MAVVIWAIGGVAVVGVIGSGGNDDSGSYDDYSDYSDYSNHSDYSDAAERARLRREAKQRELDLSAAELNNFKTTSINKYIKDTSLIKENAEHVSCSKLDQNARKVIQKELNSQVSLEAQHYYDEIHEIDALLDVIDHAIDDDEEHKLRCQAQLQLLKVLKNAADKEK